MPYLNKEGYRIMSKGIKLEGFKLADEVNSEGNANSVKNELQIDGFLTRILYNPNSKKFEIWAKK